MALPKGPPHPACLRAPQVIIMRQKDITQIIKATDSSEEVAQLTEASLSLLELIYPRHIIEHLTAEAAKAVKLQQAATAAAAAAGTTSSEPPPLPESGPLGGTGGELSVRGAPPPSVFNIDALSTLATQHEQVTILFTDIAGWVSGPRP